MFKLASIFYIVLAILVGIVALASFIDLIRAFLFPDTLSAIESMLGTGVLVIILSIMSVHLFKYGLRRLQQGPIEPH